VTDETSPVIRVLTPSATSEEIAAIVTVLAALGGSEPASEPARSEWAAPARRLRRTSESVVLPGRGAWRASGLPR
jgi:hypothetical protein